MALVQAVFCVATAVNISPAQPTRPMGVVSARACPLVPSLMYPSRTRCALSVCKMDIESVG
jgi:hypothetical protein